MSRRWWREHRAHGVFAVGRVRRRGRQFDVARVNLLMAGDADRPGKPRALNACRNSAPMRYPASARTVPKRTPARSGDRVGERNVRLVRRRAILGGHAGALEPSFVAGPGLRQEESSPPSPVPRRAPASATPRSGNWPSAQGRRVLRRDPNRMPPFFGNVVSSITRKSPAPPTSLSAWMESSRSSGTSSQTPSDTKWCSRSYSPARPVGHRLTLCDHPARSAPPQTADTSAASPVTNRSRNGPSHRASSSRQSAMPRAPKSEHESSPGRG